MCINLRTIFNPLGTILAHYRVSTSFCAIMLLMAKRILSLVLFVSLATVNIGLIIANFRPAGVWFGPSSCYFSAKDFITRCNEVSCLLDGVNPFYVWNETIDKKPYYSNIHDRSTDAEHTEIINAYTPWSYTILMPIAALPRQVAWRIYHTIICLFLVLLCTLAYRHGKRFSGNVYGGLFAAALPLSLFIPTSFDMNVGNYNLIITSLIALMAVLLDRGKIIPAAICWSLAMIKPQLAILFAIPLLIDRKIKVCIIAAVLCILATIPPAILCHESPITLILQAPKASAYAFSGCALLPPECLTALRSANFIPESFLLAIPMALGVAACAFLSWRVRKSDDPFLCFAPAAICAVSWTYVQGYSYILCAIVMIAMTADLIRRPTRGNILLCGAAILLMARMGRAFEIVVNAALPSLNGLAAIVCSWSSTAAFILVFIWLMSLPKNPNANA